MPTTLFLAGPVKILTCRSTVIRLHPVYRSPQTLPATVSRGYTNTPLLQRWRPFTIHAKRCTRHILRKPQADIQLLIHSQNSNSDNKAINVSGRHNMSRRQKMTVSLLRSTCNKSGGRERDTTAVGRAVYVHNRANKSKKHTLQPKTVKLVRYAVCTGHISLHCC